MKQLIKILILCWFLCLGYSCTKKRESSAFSMVLDVVIKQNDSIHVFYTLDGTINFSEKDFWKKVTGQKRNQKIELEFPKKVVPTQIRIDFSNNLKQEEIIFNKVEFNYKKNSFVAKGKEIYKYFRIDETNTILNPESGTLRRKDPLRKGAPSLYPNGYYLAVKLEELKYKK